MNKIWNERQGQTEVILGGGVNPNKDVTTYVDVSINRYLDKVIEGYCENILGKFPDNSIDLIVTSPPYADQRDYGSTGTRISADKYCDWFIPKAKELYRVLNNTGNFVLNINDKVINGKQSTYVYELIIELTKSIGFNLVRDYVWHNPATPPNIFSSGNYGRTKKSHEYLYWFSKSDSWYFNIDPIRKPYSKGMMKYLNGQGNGNRSHNKRPSTHSFDCEKTWKDNGGSDPGSVLTVSNTSSVDRFSVMCKEKGVHHPARFPEKLVEFFILSGSREGDIVLDPFCGSGTTLISAHRNSRRWIGIDANRVYCELAKDRFDDEFYLQVECLLKENL